MNIVLDRPSVTLTIVNGGASTTSERVEGPTVEDRVRAYVEDACAQIELWEAVAHVAKLEEYLGRPCELDEIENHVSMIMAIKDDHAMLAKVLAGAAYCLNDGDNEFFDRDEDRNGHLRRNYERRLAKDRAIRAEAKRRLG